MLFEMRKCENIWAFYLFYIVQWALPSDLYCTAPFNNTQTLVNQWFTVMPPSIIIAYLSGNRLKVYFVGHICGYWSILFLFFKVYWLLSILWLTAAKNTFVTLSFELQSRYVIERHSNVFLCREPFSANQRKTSKEELFQSLLVVVKIMIDAIIS